MFYVLDENNNKVEAFDKQGVLALLDQAIREGKLDAITADSAFINKIKCCVSGGTFNIAFVTEAQYNALKAANKLKANTYYYITDDTSYNDILDFIKNQKEVNEGNTKRIDGLGNKLMYSRTSAVIDGANGLNVELEFGKTYVFLVKATTLLLCIPEKPTSTSTVSLGAFSQVGIIPSATQIYLNYEKRVDGNGSNLKLYKFNSIQNEWEKVTIQYEISYFELG